MCVYVCARSFRYACQSQACSARVQSLGPELQQLQHSASQAQAVLQQRQAAVKAAQEAVDRYTAAQQQPSNSGAKAEKGTTVRLA